MTEVFPEFEKERRFSSRMDEIQGATTFLEETLRSYGLVSGKKDPLLFDLRLSLTEAFANVVEHGYRGRMEEPILVRLRVKKNEFRLEIEDYAYRPSPKTLRSRDLGEYRERGLGLFLISRCMDRLEYRFERNGRNRTIMRRRLDEREIDDENDVGDPFHVAVYEMEDECLIVLTGGFTHGRKISTEEWLEIDARQYELDLRAVTALDDEAADQVAAFIEALKERSRECVVRVERSALSTLLVERGVDCFVREDGGDSTTGGVFHPLTENVLHHLGVVEAEEGAEMEGGERTARPSLVETPRYRAELLGEIHGGFAGIDGLEFEGGALALMLLYVQPRSRAGRILFAHSEGFLGEMLRTYRRREGYEWVGAFLKSFGAGLRNILPGVAAERQALRLSGLLSFWYPDRVVLIQGTDTRRIYFQNKRFNLVRLLDAVSAPFEIHTVKRERKEVGAGLLDAPVRSRLEIEEVGGTVDVIGPKS
ncbi:MAG: ATP-binding protein [Candidatus Hydrogenedentota bacterium]|nr:MAG: ATP-binding protein [Candidatus Hydrogenedentota bacterium]